MIQGKKYWKCNVRVIFNEESDYFEENTHDDEDFCSSIFQPFQFEPEQKKTCGNENQEKECKHIYASAADLLHTRIGSLNWFQYRHCKNEVREVDCFYFREVNAVLIALAKIPEHQESISPSSFYGQLPDY